MSLLETNNRKFKLPFVFIAGVLFLILLTYFAKYLENMSKETTSIENTVTQVDEAAVFVRIDESENIYIDDENVAMENVATALNLKLETFESPVIKLFTLNISSVNAVRIMEIARNSKYTVVLEVSSK